MDSTIYKSELEIGLGEKSRGARRRWSVGCLDGAELVAGIGGFKTDRGSECHFVGRRVEAESGAFYGQHY